MPAADEHEAARGSRGPKCPTCRAPTARTGNPHRPFCSLTCRLIDLGRWLDERYRVAGDSPTETGEAPTLPERRDHGR